MSPEEDGSVTLWIRGLEQQSPESIERLWERYYPALVRLAEKRFGSVPRRVSGEEEIASDVLFKLFRGVQEGRISQLQKRTDLWRLLVAITRQAVIDQMRQGQRLKRGGGEIRGESVFMSGTTGSGASPGLDGFGADEPGPDFAVACDEQLRGLLEGLRDPGLAELAGLRLEGYTNEEIASRLNLSLRSVERKLQLIRQRWTQLGLPAEPG